MDPALGREFVEYEARAQEADSDSAAPVGLQEGASRLEDWTQEEGDAGQLRAPGTGLAGPSGASPVNWHSSEGSGV